MEDKSFIGHTTCFICLGIKDILIDKHLVKRFNEHEKIIADLEPCNDCKKHMESGIIFIRTETGKDFNGEFVVLKENAKFIKGLEKELRKKILEKRISFMHPEVFDMLFKGNKEE